MAGMPTQARVAVVPEGAPGPLRIESVLLPDPGPDQVLVKLLSSGVCHSQLHEIHGPREGDVVLGHEGTGKVVSRGANVSHVEVGDTVLVTWIPRTGLRLDKNGEELGVIDDPDFARAYLGVWFGKRPCNPELVKQVLGK